MSLCINAYSAVGLRRNPFVVSSKPGVEKHLFLNRQIPAQPEPGQTRIVQIVGGKGSGKTSLLLAWRMQHPGPYWHVPPSKWRRWRPPPVANIAYWDEVDRLPLAILRLRLKVAAARGATLVFGTHRELVPEVSGFGFAVDSFCMPPIQPAEIKAWANLHFLAASFQGEMPFADEVWQKLAAQYPHDWRAIGDDLHILVADYVRKKSI